MSLSLPTIGWWDGEEEFNWKKVIGGNRGGDLVDPEERYKRGTDLLEEFAKDGNDSKCQLKGSPF